LRPRATLWWRGRPGSCRCPASARPGRRHSAGWSSEALWRMCSRPRTRMPCVARNSMRPGPDRVGHLTRTISGLCSETSAGLPGTGSLAESAMRRNR
jgi:hypothetical protein